ncbi:glyoxalase [Chryseobacterium sp. SNU WT5]|uniref:glyoxalase n=1 Tax=Chryseobacterium sp. SNU WT5 TaxID=2594269 RepID=UPI00117FE98E|nr:glyoxalase [Chryseobacterium sp. SNU WT5]QDP85917.1 glyoxalase [Chryseobacterium sp. SNU WT5]
MSSKLELREPLEIPISESNSEIERFQNQTLRPVLKLQNELYLALFKTYAERQKVDAVTLKPEKKKVFIEQSLQKDSVLKNTMIGMTIGMFNQEELERYSLESKDYNKRIITMLIERIKSQLK